MENVYNEHPYPRNCPVRPFYVKLSEDETHALKDHLGSSGYEMDGPLVNVRTEKGMVPVAYLGGSILNLIMNNTTKPRIEGLVAAINDWDQTLKKAA